MGACHACSAALTGAADGVCATAIDGRPDPRGLCAMSAQSTCGIDGKCSAGACEDWPAGTACGASASCAAGMQTTPGTCDGKGTCTGAATTSCGAFLCNGTTCFTSCTSDAQCEDFNHCSGGACVGDGGPGSGCKPSLGGLDCGSGVCGTNGICCSGPCPDQGAASCGTNGTCAFMTGVCQDYPAGTTCASPSCAAGMETQARTCDGAGSCNQGGATVACAPYACGTQSCLSSCQADSQCASGDFCMGSACVAKYADGSACVSSDQCASGFCVDGFCCGTACTGACQACAAVLTGAANGTCSSVLDGTSDPRGVCAVTEASSCGTDGKCTAGACESWPAGTACAVCSGGTAVKAGACDGAGTCNGSTSSCAAGDFCWLGTCVKVSAAALGDRHTCALTTGGGVQCWGVSDFGQLGNGSMTASLVPVAVSGLSSGVTAIAVGDVHTCALTTGGGVQCWGRNFSGELGNGSTTDSPVPVAVVGLSSGVAAIAAGESTTCALTTGGGVQCWGYNGTGSVGNNSMMDSHVPVGVVGFPSGAVAIAAGGLTACALTTAGGVQCWGDGAYGQLGNGLYTSSPVPVPISGPSSGVSAIAVGGLHTCALTTAGSVRCWGWNMYGQLGNGSMTNSAIPVAVSGLTSNVVAIGAGSAHSCALTTGGGLWCWGNDQRGQLGGGSSAQSPLPVAVTGLSSGVAAVFVGEGDDTCAVTTAGALLCWGWNNNGQLGNGTTMNSSAPVSVIEP